MRRYTGLFSDLGEPVPAAGPLARIVSAGSVFWSAPKRSVARERSYSASRKAERLAGRGRVARTQLLQYNECK
jgi:hypothetical protein